jgi:hypothetical protein
MRLVVVTPAGREKYLRLLAHFVLASVEVDEWQLWDNCRNESDRAYLHTLAASDARCRLKQIEGARGGFDIIGEFFRFCDDPHALYLRLDDDIVFLEQGFFRRFIARAEAERGGALWFSPVVINNGICNWFLKYFSRVAIRGPVTSQAMCPFTWRHAEFPRAIHPVFVDAVRQGRLDLFRIPDADIRFSRFSINAVGFFGAEKIALGEDFYAPENNEEEWLSACLPALVGRSGKIFGDMAVAHFSYYTQENAMLQTTILESYYDLAGLPPGPYERPKANPPKENPPRFEVSLDDAAWRTVPHRSDPRALGPPSHALRVGTN